MPQGFTIKDHFYQQTKINLKSLLLSINLAAHALVLATSSYVFGCARSFSGAWQERLREYDGWKLNSDPLFI